MKMWNILAFYRVLYYLLAPNLWIPVYLRHSLLLCLMFFIPSLFRLGVWPTTRKLRLSFLKLTMGADWVRRYKRLCADFRQANDYEEYKRVANELDSMDGLHEWKLNPASPHYNYKRIRSDSAEILQLLRRCQEFQMRNEFAETYTNSMLSSIRHSVECSPPAGDNRSFLQTKLGSESFDNSEYGDNVAAIHSQSLSLSTPIPTSPMSPMSALSFRNGTLPRISTAMKSMRNVFEPRVAASGRHTHPMRRLMEFLRSRVMRNYCGISNAKLYSVTRVGTKNLITQFIARLRQALRYIADTDDSDVTIAEKIVFFQETRHVLGRTALCFSGGAKYGIHHLGVCRAIAKADLLPHVITGSRVGSVFAAYVCLKTTEELKTVGDAGTVVFEFMDNDKFFTRLQRLWRTGSLLDSNVLRKAIRSNLGEYTFQEAYDKTGRLLNITVSNTEPNSAPQLLNHLTAPNVVVWSAVMASCALPFLFSSQELHIKEETVHPRTGRCVATIHPIYMPGTTFSDGSVAMDLPMQRLQQLFNVDNFVVSQVNPHVAPLLVDRMTDIPLFGKMFHYLGAEFKLVTTSLLAHLRGLRLFGSFDAINTILTQKYTGDITFIAEISKEDFSKALTNPTQKELDSCVQLSERSSWKYLSRLDGMCSIEVCLDECLSQVRNRAIEMQTQVQRRRKTCVGSFEAPLLEPSCSDAQFTQREDSVDDTNELLAQALNHSLVNGSSDESECDLNDEGLDPGKQIALLQPSDLRLSSIMELLPHHSWSSLAAASNSNLRKL